MRFAFADPPYLGTAVKHYGEHHAESAAYDSVYGHMALIARLVTEFPDGWALCLGTSSLRRILPLCPEDARVGAWTKPWCSWKGNVNPAYSWEPVVWVGGRQNSSRPRAKTRDFCRVNATIERGLVGAKPELFCWWVFDLLGAEAGDELVDLFPGSGAVTTAWERWNRFNAGLFAGIA